MYFRIVIPENILKIQEDTHDVFVHDVAGHSLSLILQYVHCKWYKH